LVIISVVRIHILCTEKLYVCVFFTCTFVGVQVSIWIGVHGRKYSGIELNVVVYVGESWDMP